IINETLGQLIEDTDKNNASQLASILKEGGKSEKAEIKDAVQKAQKVRDLTASTNKWIDELKKEMLKTSGSEVVNEKVINDHSSKVATMMIDKKSKWGKEFETTLNNYVKELNAITGENFTTLAKAPKD